MVGSERWQMKHSRLSRHRYLWIYLSLMQTASQMFELYPIRNKSENNDFPVVLLFTLCWRDWKLSAFQLSTFPSILRLSARRMSSRVSILFLSSLFLEKALNFELHEKVRKKKQVKKEEGERFTNSKATASFQETINPSGNMFSSRFEEIIRLHRLNMLSKSVNLRWNIKLSPGGRRFLFVKFLVIKRCAPSTNYSHHVWKN